MPEWLYVAICLAVPQLWAVVLVRGLAAWTRRKDLATRRKAEGGDFTI